MAYGRAIQQARVTRGLTQRELASRVGVSESYICWLEGERRLPRWNIMSRLRRVLGFSLDELADCEDFAWGPRLKRGGAGAGGIAR